MIFSAGSSAPQRPGKEGPGVQPPVLMHGFRGKGAWATRPRAGRQLWRAGGPWPAWRPPSLRLRRGLSPGPRPGKGASAQVCAKVMPVPTREPARVLKPWSLPSGPARSRHPCPALLSLWCGPSACFRPWLAGIHLVRCRYHLGIQFQSLCLSSPPRPLVRASARSHQPAVLAETVPDWFIC